MSGKPTSQTTSESEPSSPEDRYGRRFEHPNDDGTTNEMDWMNYIEEAIEFLTKNPVGKRVQRDMWPQAVTDMKFADIMGKPLHTNRKELRPTNHLILSLLVHTGFVDPMTDLENFPSKLPTLSVAVDVDYIRLKGITQHPYKKMANPFGTILKLVLNDDGKPIDLDKPTSTVVTCAHCHMPNYNKTREYLLNLNKRKRQAEENSGEGPSGLPKPPKRPTFTLGRKV